MGWYVPVNVAADLRNELVCRWTATPSGRHQLVPDGCVDVLWTADGAIWVCGPETSGWSFALPPGTGAVGVRFRPGVGPAALGVDASEIRDRRVRLDEVLGDRAAGEVLDRIASTGTLDGRAAVLETAARGWLVRGPDRDPLAAHVARALSQADWTVADLADTAGLTERQLRRRCRTAFGYGPASVRRILRLQRLFAIARRAPANWGIASLAHAAGYTDQQHLARDCRSIAHQTPAEVLAGHAPHWHGEATPLNEVMPGGARPDTHGGRPRAA